jgi:response regulator RpfG family c-di-GMP phosphodiesterase
MATDSAVMAPATRIDEGPVQRVLIVDDETGVRDLMSRWLEAGGYVVKTAASADEALDRLAAAPAAVALCDIRMPGHDGLWLAERIRREYPETAVIMATGVQDVASAVESIRQGAIDYLTKPFGRGRLREAVSRGLEWHRSAWDARRWRQTLDQELARRQRRLAEVMSGLQAGSDDALEAMLSMLTLSDRDACAHAYRVAALAGSLARALAVPAADLPAIERGALLHDLGKLAMPEAILRKPAPLTAEEQALMRQCPAIGATLAAGVPWLAASAALIRDVHERMDGLGYPNAVPAAGVALGARIIAVADAYDTMTHRRVFRDAMSGRDALRELRRCSGTQFDPGVVEAFIAVMERQHS